MSMTGSKRVLIIGGAGHFGCLLTDDLRRYTDCELVVPARRVVDLWNPASVEAALSGVAVAVCAAGPFQELPVTLAEMCLGRGIHYIDLADDRSFVRKVRSLVSGDGGNLPAICSGWSTVSALSGLSAQIAATGLDQIDAVYIHMSTGNRLPKRAATIASLLYSVGRPFTIFRDGRWQTVLGWSEPRDFSFPPPIGRRRGYLVDVPDHELFPELFRARTVEFRTASEWVALNAPVTLYGWFVKRNLFRSRNFWNKLFQCAGALAGFAGHDWGGIGVEVIGSSGQEHVIRRVSVVADSGAQRIAVMPASVMTALLLSGSNHHGIVSPAHWLTPEQLRDACENRGLQLIVEEL